MQSFFSQTRLIGYLRCVGLEAVQEYLGVTHWEVVHDAVVEEASGRSSGTRFLFVPQGHANLFCTVNICGITIVGERPGMGSAAI